MIRTTFYISFDDDEPKNILSTFNDEKGNINTQIYSTQIYQMDNNPINKTNLIYFPKNNNYNYSLIFIRINGSGSITFINNINNQSFFLNSNFKGKPFSMPLSTINEIEIKDEKIIFYMTLKYEMKFEIAEINYGESKSELIINKMSPFYYFIRLNQLKYVDVNLGIMNSKDFESKNVTSNFYIEGYSLEDEDIQNL